MIAMRSSALRAVPLALALALATGAALGCGGATRPAPTTTATTATLPAADGAPAAPPAVEVHGHRGARALYPENTIEGVLGAIELGADTIEVDVLLTRDDVLVVHHDDRINAELTRDGRGAWLAEHGPPLRTLTLAELQRYDVGRIQPGTDYAARFPAQRGMDGVRIPTLRAVIEAAERASGGRVRYNIEIKTSPERPDATATPAEVADAVVALVRELGVEPRTMVQSFDWRAVARVHEIAPGLRTGCLTEEATMQRGQPGASPWTAGLDIDDHGGSVPQLVRARGCPVWTPDHRTLTPGEVAEARALGLRVVPWTVDDPAMIRQLVGWGVDGIITDHPGETLRHVAAARAD